MDEIVKSLQDVSYLGDGVYVGHDGFQFWLYTERGIGNYHCIALEPIALEALIAYKGKIMNKEES